MQEGADFCGCGLAAAVLVSCLSFGDPWTIDENVISLWLRGTGIPVQGNSSLCLWTISWCLMMSNSAQSWFRVKLLLFHCPSAQGWHCSSPAMSCLAQSLAGAGDVQASSEMCCLSSRFSIRDFLTSLENQKEFGVEGTLTDHLLPPGVSACAPAISVVSEYPKDDSAPFLMAQDPSSKCLLMWPSHVPVPFGAIWAVIQQQFNLKKQSLMYIPRSNSSRCSKNVVTRAFYLTLFVKNLLLPDTKTQRSLKLR